MCLLTSQAALVAHLPHRHKRTPQLEGTLPTCISDVERVSYTENLRMNGLETVFLSCPCRIVLQGKAKGVRDITWNAAAHLLSQEESCLVRHHICWREHHERACGHCHLLLSAMGRLLPEDHRIR